MAVAEALSRLLSGDDVATILRAPRPGAGVSRPGGRRARRRSRSGGVARRAAARDRPDHGGGDGRRRRRVQRPAARGVRRPAAGRPADGPGRAVRRQRVGRTSGATSCSTGSPAPARSVATPLGNLLIVSLWDLLGDTVEGLDLVGRLLGARGPGAADGGRAAADRGQRARAPTRHDPTSVTHGAGPGRGGLDAGSGARRAAAPAGPAGRARRRSRPSTTRTGSSWARAPGSPRVMPHLLVPSVREALVDQRPRAGPHPQPRHAQPVRPRASRPRTTWRCWQPTPPSCGWTWCWPTRAWSTTTAACCARGGRRSGAELVVAAWPPGDGHRPRHDSAAPGRGLPRHHAARASRPCRRARVAGTAVAG